MVKLLSEREKQITEIILDFTRENLELCDGNIHMYISLRGAYELFKFVIDQKYPKDGDYVQYVLTHTINLVDFRRVLKRNGFSIARRFKSNKHADVKTENYIVNVRYSKDPRYND